MLVLVSDDFGNSKWAQHELSTWLLSETGQTRKVVLPVRVKGASMPFDLANRVWIELADESRRSIDRLVEQVATRLRAAPTIEAPAPRASEPSTNEHIPALQREYSHGRLTLFCGAGVSVEAGIPGWNVLLRRLLTRLFRGESSVELAEAYQDRFASSPLIVSQYLKNALGKDYRLELRAALYVDDPKRSGVITAIRELCRPRRARQTLHSIITFNFDDLIEDDLRGHHIAYASIYREGQRADEHELPIYHVHGFLPREQSDADDYDLVFSEDAYHSQFIDSFSWSNLTQLNHLGNQTCLFVGLSLTDPNLRRLLDVSARKNPSREKRHYVIKRRHAVTDVNAPRADRLVEMANILEEDDASNLGMNVVWVNSYEEVPIILRCVADLRREGAV